MFDLISLKKSYLEIFKKEYYPQHYNFIAEEEETFKDILELFNSLNQDVPIDHGVPGFATHFYHELFKIIENQRTSSKSYGLEKECPLFCEKINGIINPLPETIDILQLKERFEKQLSDTFIMGFKKSIKKSLFNVATFHRRFGNAVLKLRKKNPIPIHLWKHIIPYQNLVKLYLQGILIDDFLIIIDDYRHKLSELHLKISSVIYDANAIFPEIDQKTLNQDAINKCIDGIKSIIKEVNTEKDDIEARFVEAIENVFEKIESDIPKVGTMEYKNKNLQNRNVSKSIISSVNNHDKVISNWNNTLYAIYDDWRADIELFVLKYKSVDEIKHTKLLLGNSDYQLTLEFKEISKVLQSVKESLSEEEDQINKSIVHARYSLTKSLSQKLIPQISSKLISKNLSGLINSLENKVLSNIDELAETRVFVSSEQYVKPLKTNDLSMISLREIIDFESFPVFEQQIGRIQAELFGQLEKINESILGLDDIAEFALESAISNLSDGTADVKSAYTMSSESIERSISRLTDIEKGLNKLNQEKLNEVEQIIKKFTDALVSYTENENIISVRLNLIKNKAVQRSVAIRNELKSNVLYYLNKGWAYLKILFLSIINGIKWLSNRFVLTAPMPVLSREVSDFLTYSNQKINSLPLIYRNLYQIRPVKDKELFVGRENELKKLDTAYEAWKSQNFSATVIIGEKWGGLTSLINHFVGSRKFNVKVFRINTDQKLYQSNDLLNEFSKTLNTDPLKSFEELKQKILDWPTHLVIVLEDMQKLFIRRMGGFEALKQLIKLITTTYEKVFWITSCTVYAWNYLSKSNSINDYFSNVIIMEKLSDDRIINIIKIRNRISGIQIEFEPSVSDLNNRKFKMLDYEGQQSLLVKKYFASLSNFAESNISLALIFWLLSTKEFTENRLLITSFEKLDLTFIKVMSMDRILTILALILHDGLNEKELSEVNNTTLEHATLSLLMLLEDGIIRKEKERFLVNPIIYRNVITMLKNKNLLLS